jgi:hypothetical protein
MDFTLEQQIEKAHADAERVEADARAIEARIVRAGGVPPTRQYGKPIDPAAIKQNLTLVSVLNRRDPALASFLGVQSGAYRREAEEREAAALRARSMEMQTEALRQRNAEAARRREWEALNGRSALTGRRIGQ